MESKTQGEGSKKGSKYWQSIVLVAALIPMIFWLRFGRIDGYVFTFTVFLILLITAVQYLSGQGNKYKNDAQSKFILPSKFDKLGIIWLLSIPFAPFLSWMVSEFFTITANNWLTILTYKAGLCILLPCICVVPLIRYINGKTALVATLVLVIGTCFPVIIGWNSMIEGPQERTMLVNDVRSIYYTRNFKSTPTDIVEVTLDNGKVFQVNNKYVSVKTGIQTLVTLEHVGVVIRVKMK